MVLVAVAAVVAAAACAKLASSVAQLLQGAAGGGTDWTENNNNNAFVNCPADVCLSSRHPCLATTVLVVLLLVSWQSFRRARRLPFAVLMR